VIYTLNTASTLHKLQGFDVDNIKQVIANQISGKEEGSALLFALISFQHWHKKTLEEN
jgi:hypothetical protein